jgi:SpoVK/Ycf46/Vps4 family AAA+-type ATPase
MNDDRDALLQMGQENMNTARDLVKMLEKEMPGWEKELGHTLQKQLDIEMLCWLLYLAQTSGPVSAARAEFINGLHLSDTRYSASDLDELILRLDLHGKSNFAELTPTVLKAAALHDRKKGNTKVQQSLIRVFDRLGEFARIYAQDAGALEQIDQQIYIIRQTNWMEDAPSFSQTPLPKTESADILDAGFSRKEDAKEEQLPEKKDPKVLMEQLNALTGLKSVKEDVQSLVNLLKIQTLRKERNMQEIPVSKHLVFTGNPGTGKTTVARLLAELYYSLGALSKGQLVEADRGELVMGYVGQTAIKVQEVVQSALGGVLFIDEAYSLTDGKDPSDFGYEAVNTLLVEMENHRDDLVVIVAGYPAPMERFLKSNPGLKSRFNKFIDFPDYTPEELFGIFEGMVSKNGYVLSGGAQEKAKEIFTELYENRDDEFANGRTVRNFFEKAIVRQANRLAKCEEITDEILTTLVEEDLYDSTPEEITKMLEDAKAAKASGQSETEHNQNPDAQTPESKAADTVSENDSEEKGNSND